MKPLVVLGFSMALAVAVGCDNYTDAPLKLNPGDKIVTFNVSGAS